MSQKQQQLKKFEFHTLHRLTEKKLQSFWSIFSRILFLLLNERYIFYVKKTLKSFKGEYKTLIKYIIKKPLSRSVQFSKSRKNLFCYYEID